MSFLKKTLIATCLLTATCSVSAATYKFAANVPSDAAPGMLLQEFADSVATKTDGRVKLKIFWNGTLGSQEQYVQQVQSGVIDLGLINSATLENLAPEIGVLNLPYIFRSDEEYGKTMANPEVDKQIKDSVAKSKLNYIGYLNNGFRGIYSAKKVSSMDDIKGFKIRTSPSDTYIKMMQAFNVVPTPLDFSEIYPALQQGIIDGGEGGLGALWDQKFGEVAKYAIRTDHSRLTDFVLSSHRFAQKIGEKDMAIVTAEMQRVSTKSLTFMNENASAAQAEAVKKLGVTFINVDKEPLIKLMLPLYKETQGNADKKVMLDTIFKLQGRSL